MSGNRGLQGARLVGDNRIRESMNFRRRKNVDDIISDGKDEQIKHLRRLGLGLTLFFVFCFLGTVFAFARYVHTHPVCM